MTANHQKLARPSKRLRTRPKPGTRKNVRQQIKYLKNECQRIIRNASELGEYYFPEFDDVSQNSIISLKKKCQQIRDLVQQQQQPSKARSHCTFQAFISFKSLATSILTCRSNLIRKVLIQDRDVISNILEALLSLASSLSVEEKGVCLTSMDQWFERLLSTLPQFYASYLAELAEVLQGVEAEQEPIRNRTKSSVKSLRTLSSTKLQTGFVYNGDLASSRKHHPSDDVVDRKCVHGDLSDDGSEHEGQQKPCDYDAYFQPSYMDAIREPDLDDDCEDSDVEYDDGEEGKWSAKMMSTRHEEDDSDDERNDREQCCNSKNGSDRYQSPGPGMSFSEWYFLSPSGLVATDACGLIARKKTKELEIWQPTEQ